MCQSFADKVPRLKSTAINIIVHDVITSGSFRKIHKLSKRQLHGKSRHTLEERRFLLNPPTFYKVGMEISKNKFNSISLLHRVLITLRIILTPTCSWQIPGKSEVTMETTSKNISPFIFFSLQQVI